MIYKKIENHVFEYETPLPFKLGTIGKKANPVDYSMDLNKNREDEIALLNKILNIGKKNIIILNQVHGDSIIEINDYYVENNKDFPDADGFITNMKNICLVIRTADCVPVFAFDVKNKAIGAVHSGWKGCRLGISGRLIKKMKSVFKSNAEDIYTYILPSIGPDAYIVNTDVASLFKNGIIKKSNKIYLDLWQNIKISMMQEGVPDSNIIQSMICTYKNSNDFFSYRRGDSGRNINFSLINNLI